MSLTILQVFAEAQKHSVGNLVHNVAGGRAGHTVSAVESAGCYAPGGRYPLPSSVLMTVITARVAGMRKKETEVYKEKKTHANYPLREGGRGKKKVET